MSAEIAEDILRFHLARIAGAGSKTFTEAEQTWEYLTEQDPTRLPRPLDKNRLQAGAGFVGEFRESIRIKARQKFETPAIACFVVSSVGWM
jgi:hypothetical protein